MYGVTQSVSYSFNGTDIGDQSEFKGYDGLHVETENSPIKILISNRSSCCESWNVKMYWDEENDTYEGEDATEVCEKLKDKKIQSVVHRIDREAKLNKVSSETSYACADIVTDSGVLHVDLSNHHNGYYPHDILLVWLDTCISDSI